jgi:hypothetical protein
MAPAISAVAAVKRGVVIGTAALCMAACGTSSSSSAAHAKCMTQFTKWREGGGQADWRAVGEAVAGYGQAAAAVASSGLSAASVSQLTSTATTLRAAVHTAQAAMPPACVAGLRPTYDAALADFARTAQGAQNATRAAQNGDLRSAVSDVRASTGALIAGAQAIRKAARDIAAFESGG